MALLRALGAAFNLTHLFMNFPLKKLKMSCKQCFDITGDAHRDKLAQKIFKDHVKLVIKDIIENNTTFKLPLSGTRSAEIHMLKIDGDSFKNLRKGGKWREIDFIKSNFCGYRMGLLITYPHRPVKTKYIYLNKELTDLITENTNKGMTYC